MPHSVSRYNTINLGTSSGESPRKREVSIARLIEIVEELKHDITGLDLELLNQVINNSTEFSTHLLNTSAHLDNATMKNLLVEMISAYQSGTLGGSGGGSLLVANRTILLATTTSSHGAIAVVQNEGTNMYVWNNTTSKWAVKEGNAYLENELPSDTDFEIIPGTELINSTTGERFTWCVSLPIPPIPPEPEELIPPVITMLAIDTTGEQLTITTDIPSYNGAGYTDANFSLSGVLSGSNIGITYVSGSGTTTRIYTIDSTIWQGDTVTLNYTSGINSVVAADGGEMESISIAVTSNESTEELIEPSYATLDWACHDVVAPVVCTQDSFYNGLLTSAENFATAQTYESNELSGLSDYGFKIQNSPFLPDAVKIPRIAPTGTSVNHFKLTAGFRFYDQSAHDCDYVLFHINNTANTQSVRLEFNYYRSSYSLFINGTLQTLASTNYVRITSESEERTYLELTVTPTSATLVHTKTTTEHTTGQTTEIVNETRATWNCTVAPMLNPVLYFGGREGAVMDAYYDLRVGPCKLELL